MFKKVHTVRSSKDGNIFERVNAATCIYLTTFTRPHYLPQLVTEGEFKCSAYLDLDYNLTITILIIIVYPR